MLIFKKLFFSKIFEKKKMDEQHDICSICLLELKNNNDTHTLPCSHSFHEECISGWLDNNTCPNCRQVINMDRFYETNISQEQMNDTQMPNRVFLNMLQNLSHQQLYNRLERYQQDFLACQRQLGMLRQQRTLSTMQRLQLHLAIENSQMCITRMRMISYAMTTNLMVVEGDPQRWLAGPNLDLD